MYCVHCGANGAMKFCASCGKRQVLESSVSPTNSLSVSPTNQLPEGHSAAAQSEDSELPVLVATIAKPDSAKPDSVRLDPLRSSTENAEMSDGLLESTPGLTPISTSDLHHDPMPIVKLNDWTMQLNYENLLSVPTARARIAASGRGASIGLTSQDLLAIFDAVSPIGISLGKLNTALLPIYDKLGIKTLRWAQNRFVAPPGRVLLALLCVMARESLTVTEVQQDVDLCQIAVDIPSSLVTNPGQLFVVLQTDSTGVYLEMRTRIPGQLVDFGKSKRLIQTVLTGIASDLQSQLSGSRVSILRAA